MADCQSSRWLSALPPGLSCKSQGKVARSHASYQSMWQTNGMCWPSPGINPLSATCRSESCPEVLTLGVTWGISQLQLLLISQLQLLLTSLPNVLHQGLSYLPLIKRCCSILRDSLQGLLQCRPPEGLSLLQKPLAMADQWAVGEGDPSLCSKCPSCARGRSPHSAGLLSACCALSQPLLHCRLHGEELPADRHPQHQAPFPTCSLLHGP